MNCTTTYNFNAFYAPNPLIEIGNKALKVGPRSIKLEESEERFIQDLCCCNSNESLKPADYFEEDSFTKFLTKLADFPIANDGGANDPVYDHNISGKDLIIEQDGACSFNHPLAILINDSLSILASDLHAIRHKPHWFKPRF